MNIGNLDRDVYKAIKETVYKEFSKHNLSIGESKQVLISLGSELNNIRPWHKNK